MNDTLVEKYIKRVMTEKAVPNPKYYLDIYRIIYGTGPILTSSLANYTGESDPIVLARVIHMFKANMLTRTIEGRKVYYQINEEFDKKLCTIEKIKKFDSSDAVAAKQKNLNRIEDVSYDVEKITSEKNKLVQYMKHIVHIETDIYALKKRYDSLLLTWEDACVDSIDDITKAEQTVDQMKVDMEKKIEELKSKINTKPSPNKKYVHLEMPVSPVISEFEGVKPTEPIYKTPGLFNKKKINAENDELRQRYENDLNLYNQSYQLYLAKQEQYRKDLELYNSKVEKIKEKEKKQNEEMYKSALKEYEENGLKWKEELEASELKLAEFDKERAENVKKQLENSISYSTKTRIEQEIQYIVNLIGKCYESQAKLYSYGVIYGKYRSYVALSSFLDYFLSGRVSSLHGPDGAYNLYEQESRANIVINKLDVIIDSLENIKENQYFIYNKLQTANSMLALINAQLLFNNVLQTEQLEKLDNIVENTATIACNTEVAAFYSKKNAELTDALGFMMAL